MTKIVINDAFGGFGLSHEGTLRFFEIKEIDVYPVEMHPGKKNVWNMWTYWLVPESERVKSLDTDAFHTRTLEERQEHNALYHEQTFWDGDIPRDDPALVQVVEEMGPAANGNHAELKVVEIPDDVEWEIHEYDGSEHVAEKHRTWR